MIFDKIDNWANYFSNSTVEKLRPAFEFIAKLDENSPAQRHEIDGDKLFCMVSEYATQPADKAQLEYHRDYIDIQLLLSGEEAIGWALPEASQETLPYSSDNDVALHVYNPSDSSHIKLCPGLCAIFFPEEGHAPCLAIDSSTTVKKVVVKIHNSLLL